MVRHSVIQPVILRHLVYVLALLIISTGTSYANTVSASPTSCDIPAYESDCTLDFSWAIHSSPTPNIHYINTTSGLEGTFSTDSHGTSVPFYINYGSTTVQARGDTTVLHSITVSASCETGSRTNGDICYTPDTMYGSISASPTSCTIATGASTCNIPITWSITGATIYPNLYNYTRGLIYSTSVSGSGVPYPIINGSNRIKIRDNNIYVADMYVTGYCQTGSSWDGSTCVADNPTATVVVTSIRCTSESLLPNWIAGVTITPTTATDYVSAHPGCALSSGWNFQWGIASEVKGMTKDFIGPADGSLGAQTNTALNEWKTFGTTNGTGVTTVSVPTGYVIRLREVQQSGYVPFTYDEWSGSVYGHVDSTPDDESAEFWCDDHYEEHRYDNLEELGYPAASSTAYCIAFNAPVTVTPTISASFATSTIIAGASYSLTWTSTNATSVSAVCTGNASSSIRSLTYTPAYGNTRTATTNSSMSGTTTCNLIATGVAGTATSSPFSLTVNATCPATATWNGSACVNPVPSISLSPMGTTAVIGTPITFTVTGNDTGNDIDFTKIFWKAPGQSDWSYDNSYYGATVTPNNGYVVYSSTSSTSETFSFTPTVAGTYDIEVRIRDNSSSRWTSTTTSAIVVTCTAGYLDMSGVCTNPLPVTTIYPGGTIFMQLGSSTILRSTSTDASSDIVIHNLTWQKPNGEDRYDGASQWGTVTYASTTTIPAGTNSKTQSATFTPNHVGYYKVRFASQDNTLSHYAPTLTDRWTYSPWTVVGVVNGTTATIIQDPANASKIKWECFNADKATLVTTGGPTTNDFVDRVLPPSGGSLTLANDATYTLTCIRTATGESSTASYAKPTITTSSVMVTSLDVAYSCNNISAQSLVFERTPGTSAISNTTSGSQTDTGLAGGTEYTYTLRCFSGLNGTGTQVGATTVRVTTVVASPPAFTVSANIRRASTDSSSLLTVSPIKADTPDGQFYDWRYQITPSPTVPTACTMEQRNDNGAWYGGYPSDVSSYTLSFSTLSTSDRQSFASGFSSSHYWRLTCVDSVGRVALFTWELQKSTAFPTVVDATLNLNCTPTPAPAITVQCANADYYEVTNTVTPFNTLSSANAQSGLVTLPTTDGTYRVTCKSGGASGTPNSGQFLRTYTPTMCTTQASLKITPRTIKAGSVAVLQWSVSQPNNSCTLVASSSCGGTCGASQIANTDALNAILQASSTDANDPYNINGETRTILNAIQTEAFNNGTAGKSFGKKTLRINNTTDFLLQCGTSTSVNARVQVSNETQG